MSGSNNSGQIPGAVAAAASAATRAPRARPNEAEQPGRPGVKPGGEMSLHDAADAMIAAESGNQVPARTPPARQPAQQPQQRQATQQPQRRPEEIDDEDEQAGQDDNEDPFALDEGAGNEEGEGNDGGEGNDDREEEDERPRARKPVKMTEDMEIEIDGHKLTAKEIRSGYMRSADYTKKTMEVAQERQAIKDEREKVLPMAAMLLDHLFPVPTMPDAALARSDPNRYNIARADYDSAVQLRGDVEKAVHKIRETQDAEAAVERQEIINNSGKKLTEIYPSWKNPEVAKAQMNRCFKYLQETGEFSEAEARGIIDWRIFPVVMKAMAFDRAQKTNNFRDKEISPTVARPAAPGAAPAGRNSPAAPGTPTKRAQEATAAFRRKPSLDSAVDAMMAQDAARGGLKNPRGRGR